LKSDRFPTMQTKKKVSVTVPEDLLAEVDRLVGTLSRSTALEQALISWLRQHRQADLDRSIEHYYRSLNEDGSAEDAEWAALGDETVRHCWAESDE
jgi:hypothetical protein